MEDSEDQIPLKSPSASIPDVSAIKSVPSIEIHPPSDLEDKAVYATAANGSPVASPHQVIVGNLGDCDFDFSQRRKPVKKTRKLVKSLNRLSSRMSSSDMASEPKKNAQRGSSDSETSLSRRIGNMLSPDREEAPSDTPKRTFKADDLIFGKPMSLDEAAMLAVSSPPFAMKDDALPAHDKQALEGRLNYHLSELDYLKKYINLHNDNVEQTAHRATMVAGRVGVNEEKAVKLMYELANAQRVLRNVAKPFVDYHRAEIDKIAEIRVQMNIDAGLGPKVPQIFKNLPNDYEWAEMFMM